MSLDEVKQHPELAGMPLVTRPRLSVQPVSAAEFDRIVELADQPAPGG